MSSGVDPGGHYLTDSPTAWRVRIRVLDTASALTHVDSQTIERARSGVARVFEVAFAAVVRAENADRLVRAAPLRVEHVELGRGSIGLWFDVRDERSRLARLVTEPSVWAESVDRLLGIASKELIAILRSQLMRFEVAADQLLVRRIPGPDGPRSRVEVSVPGAPPSRMHSDLWEWALGDDGRAARRDLLAVLAAPGVDRLEIIFYEGQESEHVMVVQSTQGLRDFAAG